MFDATTPSLAATLSPPSPPNRDAAALGLKQQADECTFTPKIPRKAPRPWERKPATPFAPRTLSHKIWKRCDRTFGQGTAQENMSNGQNERWRSVKRMRIGKVHEGIEDAEDGLNEEFIGTRYKDLGDIGIARRRKLVTVVSCGDLRSAIDEEKSVTISQTRMCGTSKIDAAFDGDASPMPSNRTRTKHTSLITEIDEAAAGEWRELQKEQHIQNTDRDLAPAETPVVADSDAKAESVVAEVAQEVTKASFLTTDGDDTEYLYAFLTRARAKKAAGTVLSPEKKQTKAKQKSVASSSPRTRSRKALCTLDRNSPSPKKIKRPDAPERKLDQGGMALSDVKATSPLRRSSRNPLPHAQRHQSATSSSIPFRRPDGTDFILLQKTEAQQIAKATTSNTRRNRGEAVRPKIKLEALSSHPQSTPPKIARKRKNDKQVEWDERLAYFAPDDLPAMEGAIERREAKTPVKRSRRLAPGKGTPAPKKRMAEAGMDVPTPLARTRTRSQGKA